MESINMPRDYPFIADGRREKYRWYAGSEAIPSLSRRQSNPIPVDVLSLGALVAIHQFVVHHFSLVQGFITGTQNTSVMHENVLPLFLADEAKPSPVIEPFNLSAGHNVSF